MNLFSVYIIARNGKVIYYKILNKSNTSVVLIDQGLRNHINQIMESGSFNDAIETRQEIQSDIYYKYRNFGDFTVVLATDMVQDSSMIATIGWLFLRFIKDYPETHLTDSSIEFTGFEEEIAPILKTRTNFRFATKPLTTISILEIPSNYRPLALKLLANPQYDLNDIETISRELNIPGTMLKKQINYLRSEGYI